MPRNFSAQDLHNPVRPLRTTALSGLRTGAPRPAPVGRAGPGNGPDRRARPARTTAFRAFGAALLCLLGSAPVAAAPVYQPPGANLVLGDVTHGQRALAASGNPAAASALVRLGQRPGRAAIGPSVIAGLEYGNLDEIFDAIDAIGRRLEPSPPGTGGPPGGNPDEKPPSGIDLDAIFDRLDPDTQAVIEELAGEVAIQAGLLTVIAAEGYARGFYSLDVPMALGGNWLGGAWTFDFNHSATSRAAGIAEPIEFSAATALANLETALAGNATADAPFSVDLSGGVLLDVDPDSGRVRARVRNDSLLLTKSATISELSVGYSRALGDFEAGSLHLGAEAKYYYTQLSRVSARFGDLTDSETLWENIRDADFRDTQRVGFDLGALWLSERYSLGATLTNVNEPAFDYPEIDTSRYSSAVIVEFLQRDETFTMERQLKVEGSLFTPDRRWQAHLGVDANAVPDPLGEEFQWLTASAAYQSGGFWLPSVRLGYRRNLAGSEMSYAALGITAFKFLNLDVASALDTTRISGTTLPRGLILSLGFNVAF